MFQATIHLFKYESHPYEHQYGGHSAITEYSTKAYRPSYEGVSHESMSQSVFECHIPYTVSATIQCHTMTYAVHGVGGSCVCVWVSVLADSKFFLCSCIPKPSLFQKPHVSSKPPNMEICMLLESSRRHNAPSTLQATGFPWTYLPSSVGL